MSFIFSLFVWFSLLFLLTEETSLLMAIRNCRVSLTALDHDLAGVSSVEKLISFTEDWTLESSKSLGSV